MGNWKGIRQGVNGSMQLFNLEKDISEENNVADMYPEIVRKLDSIATASFVPSDRYQVGNIYKGGPIWKKTGMINTERLIKR